MKQVNIFLLLVILLVACSPQVKIETPPIPTLTLAQTQTFIPTPTNTPTPTPTITFTSTATLEPSEVTFNISDGVPQEEVRDIQIGLERIRLYLRDHMGGDISPDIRKDIVIKIVANGENRVSALDERGITLWFDIKGADWARGFIPAPFQSLSDEHIKTVPHEYVHGWQSSLGCLGYHYNLLGWWMSEGLAEYIAYQTVFQRNTVEKDAVTKFMLQSAEGTEASVSLQSLESTQSKFWPGHIGYLAIDYLLTSTQSDPISLRKICEQTGQGVPVEDAFKNIFGVSKQDFYKGFEGYIHGIYIQTPQPSTDTGISGKIIWDSAYPNDGPNNYILNFCPIEGGNCLGGTSIQPDGTFFQPLLPGDYLISVNSIHGGPPIGWYSTHGMVTENGCGEIIYIADHAIAKVDFMVASPISCSSITPEYSPTPQPKTGISGKIVWNSSYPNQSLDKYMLNFCPIKGGNCLGATPIQSDGTFIQSLPPGYYWIGLNSREGQNQPLGWYSSRGMVRDNGCAGAVQVSNNIITKIEFTVSSPISCK